jgi:hypothetical protein
MSFKFYSNPSPTLPAIGANFAASGPYASYVLLTTISADAARMELTAENLSTSVAVMIFDDGSTPVGTVPPAGTATTMALAAAAVAGAPGGTFSEKFQGRVSVYGKLSTSQVAVFVR